MFKCKDCGKVFEYPYEEKESRGEFWGFPAYETMSYCPACGSEDFDEYDGEVGEDEYYDEEDEETEEEERYIAKLLGWDE